ncbi:uncharacterized protein LOC110033627 [Phalaenopsis equestris]|uniref:uncharacterized protein LOC110033627 n=1 Tax=Phalaenopsis equestris TaxID=78828 RepID=UPI0009E355AF|nr:uncharacterized protein LOC110033627 [Phalaenopsis equestris]
MERVWAHIDGFWADLANILVEINAKIQGMEKPASFLLQWCILDPFMAVVCIDKKVTALKRGMVVKAAKSKAIILSDNKSLFFASEGASKLQDHTFPRNMGQSVQPVFSDSRSEVLRCSSGQQFSPLHAFQGLKRKGKHNKLVYGTSDDMHSPSKRHKSSSRHVTKVFSNATNLHGMKHNISLANDMPVQEAMIFDGSSNPDCLNPSENSSIQTKGVCCSPTEKSNIDNDSFNESRTDRPVLSKDTPCSSMSTANQKDKFGSSNVFGDSSRRALTFQESVEIGVSSYFKPTDVSCNTHERYEDLGEVGQLGRTDFGNTSNFFGTF